MGRLYTVTFFGITGTSSIDLVEITPADDKPVVLHGVLIGVDSQVGDANERILRVAIRRGDTASGSGGSTDTPKPVNPSDASAGFTAEIGNTTVATGGGVGMIQHAFNVRVGWVYIPLPEHRIKVKQGELLVLRVPFPPTTIVYTGTMIVEEIG